MKDHGKYLYKKIIKIPIYRGFLIIILSNSKRKINKIVPFEDKIPYAHSIFSNYLKSEGYFIILNFHNKAAKITPGILTHESIHIANFIASQRGIELDANNDEPICYLAGWITDQICTFLLKKGFKLSGL